MIRSLLLLTTYCASFVSQTTFILKLGSDYYCACMCCVMSMAKSSVIGVRREENGGIVSGISRIGSLGGPGPTSPVVVILMFAVAVLFESSCIY